MRLIWVCVGFGLLVQGVGACGSNEHAGSAQAGGSAGKGSGGVAGQNAGGAAASAGGSGHGAAAGSAGVSSTGGAGGTSGASASGAAGDESAGAGGISLGEGGQAGAADTSGGSGGSGGGSGGSSGSCGAPTADKLVFISSAVYTGNLGGLAGADLKCQALAKTAGLCGTFKAWLSDDTGNAADRLTHATGNYVLPDGQIVANGWAGLSSATHLHAIDVTETKATAPVGTVSCGGTSIAPVWTGATWSGVAVTNGSCSSWGSSGTGSGGIFGNALASNGSWSGMCQLTTVCASTAALYCIEQ